MVDCHLFLQFGRWYIVINCYQIFLLEVGYNDRRNGSWTCECYDRSLCTLLGVGIRETSTVMRKSDNHLDFLFKDFSLTLYSIQGKTFSWFIWMLISCFVQNGDGGFATYELTRSYSWLEVITLTIAFIPLPHLYI